MTSKERVLTAINFEKPDRVPFNFWMDRRLMESFEKKHGPHFRVTEFGADVIETFIALAFPMGTMVEESGTSWLTEPLIKDWTELDGLQMPDPYNEDAYALVKKDLEEFPDKAVIADCMGVLTIMHGMRSYDHFYLDIYDHPDKLKKLFQMITDVMKVAVKRVCELGVTAVYVMDDIAYANGLLMSLPQIREFVYDFNQQQIDVAKEHGVPVFMHSCGQVTDALDYIQQSGVNVINPLQPHLHDFNDFKNKYHGKLAVYGALDNTHVIPHGSTEDIKRQVHESFDVLGKDGGLVFSSHDIPLNTPEENIYAMVEAIKECRYD